MNKKTDKKDEVFKSGQIKDIVLAALGLSLIVGGIIVTPQFPLVLGALMKLIKKDKNTNISPHKVKRVLKALEKKQVITIEERGEDIAVYITDRYNTSLMKYSIRELLTLKKKKEKWGGKWYMVLFDVPEVQRTKRYHIRKFLKDIGFYPYQQSVYVFPYECEKEVQLIARIVGGEKYMRYVQADVVEKEPDVKRFFGIKT